MIRHIIFHRDIFIIRVRMDKLLSRANIIDKTFIRQQALHQKP